jgi:hypothetical protein
MGYLYRYEDVAYASIGRVSIDGDILSSYLRVKVELRVYKILKTTLKGIWVVPDWYTPRGDFTEDKMLARFVLLSAKKKFACYSKEEALESFQTRKKRQIKILKGQLDRAEKALEISEEIQSQGI